MSPFLGTSSMPQSIPVQDTHTDRQTHRQTDRQAGRQTDRQADTQTDRHTDTQTHRQTGRQVDEQRMSKDSTSILSKNREHC